MICHYPDLGSASDWSCRVGILFQPIRSTTQIWVVLLIGRAARETCFNQSKVVRSQQYGISVLIPHTPFLNETSGGARKCWLLSQATII